MPSTTSPHRPAFENCRRIDFEKAEVVPGIIPGTWFLVVDVVERRRGFGAGAAPAPGA